MKLFQQIKGIYSKFYYIFTAKQRRGCLFLFVLLFLGSFLEMLGVSAIVPLVQAILTPETLLENNFLKPFFDFLGMRQKEELVVFVSVGIVLVYLFKNLYMTFLSYYKNRFYRGVEKEMSMRLMNSYLGRAYTFHINTNTATLLRSIVYDITGVSATLTSIFTIIMEFTSAFLIIIVLLVTDFGMAMTLMCSALLALMITIVSFEPFVTRIPVASEMRRDGI